MALVSLLRNILALFNNIFRESAHSVGPIWVPCNLVSVQMHQDISSVHCKHHLVNSELCWVGQAVCALHVWKK